MQLFVHPHVKMVENVWDQINATVLFTTLDLNAKMVRSNN